MIDLFWDLYQDRRIAEGVTATSDARTRAEMARELVAQLESRVDRLTLANAAMWEIMQQQLGVTDEVLKAKVAEIDIRDGRLDGKIDSRETTCSKCRRKLSRRHAKCLYCGENVRGDSV